MNQNVRKQLIKVPSKTTSTINMLEPTNYFRLVNSGTSNLYCGLSNMPSKEFYDFKVSNESSRVFCDIRTHQRIYIYNDGTEEANILLYTFQAPFDASVLAFSDSKEIKALGTIDVEISGFSKPLPTGNNKIGKVEIENYNNIQAALDEINLNVKSCNAKLEALKKRVDYIKKDIYIPSLFEYKWANQHADITYTFDTDLRLIKYIRNKGFNLIEIQINEKAFLLSPNESLENFSLSFNKITFHNVSSNEMKFEFLGVY